MAQRSTVGTPAPKRAEAIIRGGGRNQARSDSAGDCRAVRSSSTRHAVAFFEGNHQ